MKLNIVYSSLLATAFSLSIPFSAQAKTDPIFEKAQEVFLQSYQKDGMKAFSDRVVDCFTVIAKQEVHLSSERERSRLCFYLDAAMFTLDQMRRISLQKETGKDPGPLTFYFDPRQAHIRLTMLAIDLFGSLKDGQDRANAFIKTIVEQLKSEHLLKYDVPLKDIKTFY